MKVILTTEVLGLGDPGEVVNVKNGYGRNYLIPRGMALQATKKNMAMVEAERKRIAGQQAREAEKVSSEADKLRGLAVNITARAGEGGKLYGSVTNMDVATAMAELGFEIDRRRIILEQPLKKLGEYPVKVKLHPQVVVDIQVTVEALDTGEAVEAKAPIAQDTETEEAAVEEVSVQAAEDQEPKEAQVQE